MPTYQYACRSCEHRFEAVQGFHEASLTTCPACEQQDLRKVFGNVGVVFKGSGFYRNDSRSGAKSTGADSGKPAAKESSSGGDTKSGGTGEKGSGAAPASGSGAGSTSGSGSGTTSGGSGSAASKSATAAS